MSLQASTLDLSWSASAGWWGWSHQLKQDLVVGREGKVAGFKVADRAGWGTYLPLPQCCFPLSSPQRQPPFALWAASCCCCWCYWHIFQTSPCKGLETHYIAHGAPGHRFASLHRQHVLLHKECAGLHLELFIWCAQKKQGRGRKPYMPMLAVNPVLHTLQVAKHWPLSAWGLGHPLLMNLDGCLQSVPLL